jgi:hypothetical protein
MSVYVHTYPPVYLPILLEDTTSSGTYACRTYIHGYDFHSIKRDCIGFGYRMQTYLQIPKILSEIDIGIGD